NAINGSATLSSTATASSDVGNYAINLSSGTLSSDLGYQFTGFNDGTLTINKAPLNVSLAQSNYSCRQGIANPNFNLNYNGFKLGETANVIDSLPNASTNANRTSPGGQYDITISGGTDNNYMLSYSNPAGQLTVDQAIDLPSSWEQAAYNNSGDTGSSSSVPTPEFSAPAADNNTGTSPGAETEESQTETTNEQADNGGDSDNGDDDSPINRYGDIENDEDLTIPGLNVKIETPLARILGLTQQKLESLFR
ncbi:MAG: MBG domain-containing protein, partial [Pseudomonadota bacterium]